MNVQQLENELWEAADQLRANSKLTAAEYSMPVLGLIFLRHADNRFKTYLPEIEADIPPQVPAAQRETLIKLGFQGKAAIYLPEEARFDRIASLPRAADVGQVIDQAMDAIEAEYDVLKGALPRGYAAFEPDLLAELVKIFDRPAIKADTGDVFGRIYEYFLNKFAMSGAQEGGEFFTPPSLVRMIVNVIEAAHGLVLDPACGSAGMFVQTDIQGEHFADAGTYMVLTPGNFFEKGGFRVRDGKERYYLADFPEEFLLAKGDLIVAMTEQGEGLLGSAARIPDHVKYLHNQRLGLVQVTDPALFDKRFLYWVFNSAGVRARLRATATGAKVKHTAPERIRKVRLVVPDVRGQQAIASTLDAYDALIATKQRRVALLEEAARRLYREWFVQLRFPGHESVPVNEGLPQGWQRLTLDDVCEAVGGGTPSTTRPDYWDGGVMWVTPTDVTRNDCLVLLDSGKKITEAGLANSSAKLVPPDTILMTSRTSIGFFALMEQPACTNQGFISVLPKQPNSRMFLLFNLLGRVEKMIGLATGATFKELSKTFRALPVVCPTDGLLTAFEEMAYPMIQQVRWIKKQNQQLARARDLLLPKLMSGQLDVSGIRLPEEATA